MKIRPQKVETDHLDTRHPCKTCGHPLEAEANFCPHCGAKRIRQRLGLRTLFGNLLVQIGNLDFHFYRTTRDLLLRPEQVTIGYINGVRKIISAPTQYALIVLSLYGLFQFFFADFLNLILKENLLEGIREGFNNYESSDKRGTEFMNQALNWIQSRNQFFLFILIPFMSFFAWLFFLRRGYNLAEHTVMATYAVSFSLIISVLIGLVLAPIGTEAAVKIYLNTSTLLSLIAITWVVARSLKRGIFIPLLILIISFICLAFLLFITLAIIYAYLLTHPKL